MPVEHDFKIEYKRIMQQIIRGSMLIKVKAKRLYTYFASWMYTGYEFTPFDNLPIQEQKSWIMAVNHIPYDDYDDDDEV